MNDKDRFEALMSFLTMTAGLLQAGITPEFQAKKDIEKTMSEIRTMLGIN